MISRQAFTQKPDAKPGVCMRLISLLIASIAAFLAAAPTASLASTASPAPDPEPGEASGFSSPRDLRTLIDQEERPFSFAKLGDKTVVMNFIFTSCPMSCPAQTQALVGIQLALPPALSPRVRFVSVTIDPDRDKAPVLKAYAASMGADLSGWSFVTGKTAELDWLQHFYAAAASAGKKSQLDHEIAVFLLDARGRLMQKYTGDFDKRRLLREIGEVASLNK
jgi:protein SCO1/2